MTTALQHGLRLGGLEPLFHRDANRSELICFSPYPCGAIFPAIPWTIAWIFCWHGHELAIPDRGTVELSRPSQPTIMRSAGRGGPRQFPGLNFIYTLMNEPDLRPAVAEP